MILGFNNKKWRVFGETLDITIGQLLDQFGRAMGFASPCGSVIEQLCRRVFNAVPHLTLHYKRKRRFTLWITYCSNRA